MKNKITEIKSLDTYKVGDRCVLGYEIEYALQLKQEYDKQELLQLAGKILKVMK